MGNRGVLSSLGAGLSLVVAGVIVLVIVSGFVAFRGWPGVRSDERADSVRMARVADPPAERSAPVVVGGATADRRSASGSGPGRRSSARRGSRRAGSPRGVSRGGAAPGGRDRGGSRDTGTRGRPGSRPSAGSGTGRDGGSGSGSRSGAQPGPAPRRQPDPVGRAVEGLGRTVDHITEPKPEGASPVNVPQVVGDTTQTADEVAEDTTQVVQDVVDGAGGTVGNVLP